LQNICLAISAMSSKAAAVARKIHPSLSPPAQNLISCTAVINYFIALHTPGTTFHSKNINDTQPGNWIMYIAIKESQLLRNDPEKARRFLIITAYRLSYIGKTRDAVCASLLSTSAWRKEAEIRARSHSGKIMTAWQRPRQTKQFLNQIALLPENKNTTLLRECERETSSNQLQCDRFHPNIFSYYIFVNGLKAKFVSVL